MTEPVPGVGPGEPAELPLAEPDPAPDPTIDPPWQPETDEDLMPDPFKAPH